ncbi:MAG: hypothetical protein QOG91_547 [Candidatus Parcubacteria bacterium]|jgi:hypothetical protein|nr:hypothetical protein [Candidatus Parcubacteria bacterium]
MIKAISQTYRFAQEYRRQITCVLVIACAVFAYVYAVNIYRVISHTVALEKIEKEAASLSGAVGLLDSEYLDLSSKITPDNLKAYGFSEGQVSAYISRTSSLGSVALRGHEL